MPQAVLIPILAAVASSGVGFGLQKAFTPSEPSFADEQKAQQAQAQSDADKQAKADAAAKAQALKRSAPDAQAQTGGSLTDAPFASLVQSISGQPGNIQEAMRALGLGGGGSSDSSGGSQVPELAFSGGS